MNPNTDTNFEDIQLNTTILEPTRHSMFAKALDKHYSKCSTFIVENENYSKYQVLNFESTDQEIDLNKTYSSKTMDEKELSIMLAALDDDDDNDRDQTYNHYEEIDLNKTYSSKTMDLQQFSLMLDALKDTDDDDEGIDLNHTFSSKTLNSKQLSLMLIALEEEEGNETELKC